MLNGWTIGIPNYLYFKKYAEGLYDIIDKNILERAVNKNLENCGNPIPTNNWGDGMLSL